MLSIMAKHLHIGIFCPNDIDPEVLWSVEFQIYKPKLCYYVIFRDRGIFFWQPYLLSIFLIVLSCSLTVNMLNKSVEFEL